MKTTSKLNKNIWIIAIVLIVSGAALTAAGWAMGARGGIYIDRGGVHASTNGGTVRISEENIGAFTDISVDADYANIKLIASDKYAIDIQLNDGQTPDWTITNGKLSVNTHTVGGFQIGIMNFNMGESYVKIYVPENAALENVTLNTSSGDISLTDAEISRLKVDNAYGKLVMDNVKSGEADIKMSAGSVTIDGGETGFLKIKNSYGSIKADGFTSRGTDIHASSGSIKLRGVLTGENSISDSYGSVLFETSAGEQDYAYELSTAYGSIKVNGKTRGGDVSRSADSGNTLDIHASAGSIEVNFGK